MSDVALPPEFVARALLLDFEAAWNRHDAAALGALVTEDAEWVNRAGRWWRGRATIERAHAALHATTFRDTRTRVGDVAARAVAPDVIVAVATLAMGAFTTPDGRVVLGSRDSLTLVLVRRDGVWRIAHGADVPGDPRAPRFDPAASTRAPLVA